MTGQPDDDDRPDAWREEMPVHAVARPLLPKHQPRPRRRRAGDDWDPAFPPIEPPPGWEP